MEQYLPLQELRPEYLHQWFCSAKVANYLNMKMTHMNSPWSNQLKDVNKRVHLVAKDGNQTGNWYDNISNLTVDNPNSMYTCIHQRP